MKIEMRWSHDIENGATIKEFANMEMRPTTPNPAGVFEDHITIPVCKVSGYLFLIHVAKDADGYHVSTTYESNTGGGGSWPSKRSKAYKTKQMAFEAGIKDLSERDYFKQYSESINQALITYKSTSLQLSLF